MASSVLATIDYVVIGVMLFISAGLGIYFRFTGGRQQTTLEFLMADKNMSILPVCFSILATSFSAVFVLGGAAEAYFYGAQISLRAFSQPLAIVIVAYCILPIYFEMNVNSIYEYLERRFGKVIKLFTSVLYTIQMILFMTVVIYAPSLALSTVTGLSMWICVISMSLVCTFYSTLGGLKAVLWTDLFQALLMLFTIYALITKGALDFGGFQKIFETAQKGQRLELFNTSTDITVRYTFWNTLMQGFLNGLVQNGVNFSIIQRLISCGNIKKAQRCLLWSVPLFVIVYDGACFLGIVMYSYYNECDPIQNQEVESADQGAAVGLIAGFAFYAWIGFGSLYNKSKYPTLPLSSAGCSTNVSAVFDSLHKEYSMLDMEMYNFTTVSSAANTEERYIFSLYKISYFWFVTFSFLLTVIAGYIASYITGIWKKENTIDPRLLSPLVRKWLPYTYVPQKENECIQLHQGTNKALMNADLDEARIGRI